MPMTIVLTRLVVTRQKYRPIRTFPVNIEYNKTYTNIARIPNFGNDADHGESRIYYYAYSWSQIVSVRIDGSMRIAWFVVLSRWRASWVARWRLVWAVRSRRTWQRSRRPGAWRKAWSWKTGQGRVSNLCILVSYLICRSKYLVKPWWLKAILNVIRLNITMLHDDENQLHFFSSTIILWKLKS